METNVKDNLGPYGEIVKGVRRLTNEGQAVLAKLIAEKGIEYPTRVVANDKRFRKQFGYLLAIRYPLEDFNSLAWQSAAYSLTRYIPSESHILTYLAYSFQNAITRITYDFNKRRNMKQFAVLSGGDGKTAESLIESPSIDDCYFEDYSFLHKAIGNLSDREKEVIQQRFFAPIRKPSSRKIAKDIGVSKSRVNVILESAQSSLSYTLKDRY